MAFPSKIYAGYRRRLAQIGLVLLGDISVRVRIAIVIRIIKNVKTKNKGVNASLLSLAILRIGISIEKNLKHFLAGGCLFLLFFFGASARACCTA